MSEHDETQAIAEGMLDALSAAPWDELPQWLQEQFRRTAVAYVMWLEMDS